MDNIFSVSQITAYIRELLITDPNLKWVAVEGEVSNYYQHKSSGHIYFTLKDDRAKLNAVMFRAANKKLDFNLEAGMEVIAQGKISLYSPRGEYQIQVEDIKPSGEGALHIAFKQLKKKLEKEGLFKEEFKESIPEVPQRVGVVTSPNGAAIRDIISVIKRRFSNTSLLIAPATVQGKRAEESIIKGIKLLQKANVDVIIIGRGGGSLEDLWAFNKEELARVIFNSKVPIISAVGHETDYTISDYAADLRAPTPSAAAELVVADRKELRKYLKRLENNLYQAVKNKMQRIRTRLKHLLQRRAFRLPEEKVKEHVQQIDELRIKLDKNAKQYLKASRQRLDNLGARLDSLSPLKTLERGYSVTTDLKTGMKIDSVEKLNKGELVEVLVKDGNFISQIKEINEKKRGK